MSLEVSATPAAEQASPVNDEEVRSVIRRLAGALTVPVPLVSADPAAAFVRDLGYDSLRVLEFVQNVEEAFQLPPIQERALMTIITVSNAEELVLKLLNARAIRSVPDGLER